ncbi:uncharacterized protein [Canis lupus baileyi]|uniref:uncharacterized protein n=1 Tax=Canis lupus baileyi TaxID=143281 RepID=UPI003B97AFB0
MSLAGRSSGLSVRACGCVPACVHKRVRAQARGLRGPSGARDPGLSAGGGATRRGCGLTRAVRKGVQRCSLCVGCCSAAASSALVAARRPLCVGCSSAAALCASVAARRPLLACRLRLGGSAALHLLPPRSGRAPAPEAAAPGGPVPSDALRRRCREETVTGAGFVCWSPWTEEREGARPRLLRFSKWCVTQSSLSGSVKNHFQIRKWREGFLREDFRSQRK